MIIAAISVIAIVAFMGMPSMSKTGRQEKEAQDYEKQMY